MTVEETIKERGLKWFEYVCIADYIGMVGKIPSDMLWLEVRDISVDVGVFLSITYMECEE